MAAKRLHVVRACGEDWDAMRPDGGGRHCASCDRVVVDVRGMSRVDTDARIRLVLRAEGRACARGDGDPTTGELLFAPPPRATGGRALVHGALVAAALATGCGSTHSSLTSAEPAARLVPLESKPDGPTPASGPVDAGTPAPATADGGATGDGGAQAAGARHHRRTRHGHGGTPPPLAPMMGDIAYK